MQRLFITLCALFISTAALAQEGVAQDVAVKWLQKMGEALHTLNYDGVFIYQRGDQISSMRVIHGLTSSGEHEKLINQSGPAREVIRSYDKITCILPDEHAVIVEDKNQTPSGFPYILPSQIDNIQSNYHLKMGGSERISGRQARQLEILPSDQYRYAYRLWLDEKSGMLLKAELADQQGVVERFMFTSLRFLPEFSEQAMLPDISRKEFLSYQQQRRDEAKPVAVLNGKWKFAQLPVGFSLKSHQYRLYNTNGAQNIAVNPAVNEQAVHHLILSDGLATVSVFIEKLHQGETALQGPTTLGAVNTFTTLSKGYQITAVGEVPARTVKLIAETVYYQP